MKLKSAPNLAPKSDNEVFESFVTTLSQRFKGRTLLIVEMSKIFLEQAPTIKKILTECPAKKDYESIRFESHKFKSTVNILGLNELRELAARTEELYHNGAPQIDTTELLNNFVNQINVDIEKVEKVIQEISRSN